MIDNLVKRAEQIDNRLGPISGQTADAIAVQLREAAAQLKISRLESDSDLGVIEKLSSDNAELRAEIEALQKALKPMTEPGKIFGDDWSDNDELAVMPFDPDEEYGYDLLFTMKVGDYRTATKLFDSKPNISHEDRVLSMMQEDAAKIIEKLKAPTP